MLFRSVEEWVRTYGLNAGRSILNTVEVGINLQLPFPVDDLLRALICYRGVPFTRHNDNGFDYYQAKRQQYVVKVYDKGTEYDLPGNVLRFEIKVLRMHYLHRQGIHLNVLADLLNPAYYPALGRLLTETFEGILFDEPLLSKNNVPTRYRELLIEGRNPRYWQQPKQDEPGPVRWSGGTADYEKCRKQLQRDETRFRKILADHRPGPDWQSETAANLRAEWEALTHPYYTRILTGPGVNCPELTGVTERGTVPDQPPICPELTGVDREAQTGHLSRINTKDVGVIRDKWVVPGEPVNLNRGTPVNTTEMTPTLTPPQVRYCRVTGLDITHQRANTHYLTATTIRYLFNTNLTVCDLTSTSVSNPNAEGYNFNTNLTVYDQLAREYLKRSDIPLDKQFVAIAHNIRNRYTNPPNNTRRSVERRITDTPLFPASEVIKLTNTHRANLDYWLGTRWEVRLG